MEKTNYYNLLSIVTGLTIVLTGSTIAYYFQKKFFSRYRNKISNIVDKKPSDKP